ncbi:GrpB family protein [Thermocoleostomius sinensis]|uniref:GrpB family protein n=1 Tax=Thermocoleostomius sinensis A174 TaxID=2016057 RepID=A0A9E9CA07_9CYAN|nr:GrpB family protein [Thermocoleostomius sinensis]WAL62238.1 GrpB family protein [Thermocoleostomius sinensis A174]
MDEIEIVDYDPTWPEQYEQEAAKILGVLDRDRIAAIEHVGSTAIPGLAAKPIIDVMVGVHSIEAAQAFVPLLEGLGYVYWSENPHRDRLFFVKGMPPYGARRTHHIHVFEVNSELWQRRLLFRDYLRSHPADKQDYEALKRQLATQFRTDREAYTERKRGFIDAIVAKA